MQRTSVRVLLPFCDPVELSLFKMSLGMEPIEVQYFTSAVSFLGFELQPLTEA